VAVQKLNSKVLSVGAKHWDRELFDELIPLPDGTTYNSYIIEGKESTALIDTVDPETIDQLMENLDEAGVEQIDYIIANHAEQDHSGGLPYILEEYPEATIITNSKCKRFLTDLLPVEEDDFKVVEDGEEISLGDKTLEFLKTPWVHWPETLSTYLQEDNILFPCDFFGAHIAASKLYVQDEQRVLEAAKRYYAEIMMPFRGQIKKNMKKLEGYEIDEIAPSHGQVYSDPSLIMDAYSEWISDDVKNEVVLPYVSMHGSTKKMVDHLIDALTNRDIVVKPFNLTKVDLGELAKALVDAATIVLASPTMLTGTHPEALYGTVLVNALRPKTKYAAIIGSYGWGGKMEQEIKDHLNRLNVDLFSSVIKKGHPDESVFEELDQLADSIKDKHKDIN